MEKIRLYHKFVDRIDNSVPRVTAWHHEALPSDNTVPKGQICLSYALTHVGFFFLHTLGASTSINQVSPLNTASFMFAILKTDVILTFFVSLLNNKIM